MKRGAWLIGGFFVGAGAAGALAVVRQMGLLEQLQSYAAVQKLQEAVAGQQENLAYIEQAAAKVTSMLPETPSLSMTNWTQYLPQLPGQWELPQVSMHSPFVYVGLILIGWLFMELVKGKFGTVLGSLLFIWGAAQLLPKVLLVPFLLIAAYFTYRLTSTTGNKAASSKTKAEATGFGSHTSNYLDSWEKQKM